MLEVCTGNVDLYLHTTHIKKWDLLAGHAIVLAMGGTVTDLDNNLIDYSMAKEYRNQGGLMVTLTNHSYYLEKLKPLVRS